MGDSLYDRGIEFLHGRPFLEKHMKNVLFIAGMFATTINGESMKLVDPKTDHAIIEFKDNTVKFYSAFLEKILRQEGISIPPGMRSSFNGKEVIFIDDPLFEKAFIEVFWPFHMDSAYASYEWRD